MSPKVAVSAAIGSCIVAVPFVFWALMPPEPEPGPPPPAYYEPEPAAPEVEPEDLQEAPLPEARASVVMQRGDTLAGKLVSAGLDRQESHQVAEALGSIMELTKMQVGTILDVSFDPSGAFARLELSRDGLPVGRVARQDDALSAELAEVTFDTSVVSMAGQIDGSLWKSMEDLGEQPELAIEMSKLFLWQVDFGRELQPGDRFNMIVEKKTREGRFMGYGKILAATLENGGKTHTAFYFESEQGPSYWNAKGESQKRRFLRSPVEFTRISSRFTSRRFHPVLKVNRPHWGVDYAAPYGTPVMAAGDGQVTLAGRNGGLGITVGIAHGNGIVTKYGHLKSIARGIRRGVRVRQGEVVGYVGSTGLSTGPHLDFRFQKDGKYVDPLKFVDDSPPLSLQSGERVAFEQTRDRFMGQIQILAVGDKTVLEERIAGRDTQDLNRS